MSELAQPSLARRPAPALSASVVHPGLRADDIDNDDDLCIINILKS